MATLIDKVYSLNIGVQGENIARAIELDMTEWVAAYPDASFHVLFKPYNESEAVPMVSTFEDNILTWAPTLSATAVSGVGYTEIRALDPETGLIRKSRIIPTSVENSVTGADENPPQPYVDWVNRVLEAGSDAVKGAAAVAAVSQGEEVAFEIDADGHLNIVYTESGEPQTLDLGPVDAYAIAVVEGYTGTREEWVQAMADAEANGLKAEGYAIGKQNGVAVESGEYYQNNAKYYNEQAQSAKEDAEAAQTAAETAQTAAETAQTSAEASAAEAAQYTSTAVHTWLENNIDPATGYALDRTLTEPLEAAPADMVGDLKSAFLRDVISQFITPVNIPVGDLILNGQINPSAGNNMANSAKTTRTDYLTYDDPVIITIDNSDYEYCVWCYTKALTANAVYSPSDKAYTQNLSVVYPAGNQNKFRMGIRRIDNADLTTDQTDPTSDYSKIVSALKFYRLTDESLTIHGASADSKAVGDKANNIIQVLDTNATDCMGNSLALYGQTPLILVWEQGSITNAGNEDSKSFIRTPDYIDVTGIKAIRLTYTGSGSRVFYYNSNKGVLSNTDADSGKMYMIPSNVKYIRIRYLHESNNTHPTDSKYCQVVLYSETENNSVENKLKTSAFKTKNHFSFGNQEFTGVKTLPLLPPLNAGTYTISFYGATDATSGVCSIVLLKHPELSTQSNVIQTLTFSTSVKSKATFTLSEAAYGIQFRAASTEAGSDGVKCAIYNVQIEEGNTASAYNHPFASFDERLDSISDRQIKTYTDFKAGYIDTSGNTINPESPVSSDVFCHAVIPCSSGDQFVFECCGGNGDRVLFCFCDEEYNILYKSFTTAESKYITITNKPENRYIAPPSAKWLFVNHHNLETNGYSPKVYKLSKNEFENYIATAMTGELPYINNPSWKGFVVATYKSMIAIKMGGYLRLSRDCGKTWNDGINVSSLGGMVNFHLFMDGTLAFFTDTKAYYTHDWETYDEADCFESDGVTPYEPSDQYNFNSLWDYEGRKIVNGQDLYVFGNYTTTDTNYRRLVWYSDDNGETYKIAYEFSASTYEIRHIHSVMYIEDQDVYLVTTGDSNQTECMIFALEYGSGWEASLLAGPARSYKWAGLAYWNNYIYYCIDNTPGGVKRCKYDDIGDLTKHETILEYTDCDTECVLIGKRGDIVITQGANRNAGGIDYNFPFTEYESCRKIYYSTDQKNFVCLYIPPQYINGPSSPIYSKPVTSDGQCFVGISHAPDTLPSVCLDDIVRMAGYRTAFGMY